MKTKPNFALLSIDLDSDNLSLEARGELKPTNPLPTHELNSVQDYPPNLSILLSGGKETNKDGLSNGE